MYHPWKYWEISHLLNFFSIVCDSYEKNYKARSNLKTTDIIVENDDYIVM